MESLEDIIKAHIRLRGPMTIAAFMELALAHPRLGYYMTRDPLGSGGDFTTAPEISQLFGEMIGLWLADLWLRAGAPLFHLVELGPGRGTLMADLLRATRHVSGFHAKARLHLVETSPPLREAQAHALETFAPCWHKTVAGLPQQGPLLVVANEFFDALPARQALLTERGWRERMVGLDARDALVFGLGPTPTDAALPAPDSRPPGSFYEFSPAREAVMDALALRLSLQGGALLAIDYGYEHSGGGDTFQALKNHAFHHPLTHVGNADLTTHVDFGALARVARARGCRVHESVTQKSFLEHLGIGVRLAQLGGDEALAQGVARLLDADTSQGMGALFRAIAFSDSFYPAWP